MAGRPGGGPAEHYSKFSGSNDGHSADLSIQTLTGRDARVMANENVEQCEGKQERAANMEMMVCSFFFGKSQSN